MESKVGGHTTKIDVIKLLRVRVLPWPLHIDEAMNILLPGSNRKVCPIFV